MSLIKSNIYKWHRSLSLIIAIPVLLWAASGFMHPLMTNIRPKIATQGLSPIPVDSSKIRVPLQAALRMHHLDSISNFRLVHIDTNWFYQVLPAIHNANPDLSNNAGHPNRDAGFNNPGGSGKDASANNPGHSGKDVSFNNLSGFPAVNVTNIPIYLSCQNGHVLPAGDWLYAQYLARQFLEGSAPSSPSTSNSAPVYNHTSTSSSKSASGSASHPGPAPVSHPEPSPVQSDSPTNHSSATAHRHNGIPPASSAQTDNHPATPAVHQHSLARPTTLPIGYATPSAFDCCGAATDCVLNPVKGAKVANVSLLKDYDPEYKSINKLLPVYRVSFNRPDGIRVYVETTRDRFAFAMDNRRFVFDRIFTLVHTWAWLDFLGKGKLLIEFILVSMAFLTTLIGVYLFFVTVSKKANGNKVLKARRTHRFTAIAIALFTLLFTFSGAFHVISKFREDTRDRLFVAPSFASADLKFNFTQLQAAAKDPITDIRIVHMKEGNYWQITTLASSSTSTSASAAPSSSPPSSSSPHEQRSFPQSSSSQSSSSSSQSSTSQPPSSLAQLPSSSQTSAQQPFLKDTPASPQPPGVMSSAATHTRDLMKDPQAATAPIIYLPLDSPYAVLQQGERKYAGFLAAAFSGQPIENSQCPVPILRFTSEYNFADKRLPVWKVGFPTHDNERYYVETSTGRLAKRVTDITRSEEYSFAFFHKHEFMGWGGRGLKDFSTMFWALAQIAMVVIGLILYFKSRRQTRKKSYDKKHPTL